MPTVTSPQQLFEHELKDMYYAEMALTKVLPKLANEASDGELSRAFTSHLKETEKHVSNLEKVFTKIGKTAQATPCPGIEGIKKEHDEFVQENLKQEKEALKKVETISKRLLKDASNGGSSRARSSSSRTRSRATSRA